MNYSENERKRHIWVFEAKSDIWTGSLNFGSSKNDPPFCHTGMLGSLRWWFEVLVRGLGGSACDPSQTQCDEKKHCVVCELFGCTGWARKFRFEVLSDEDSILMKSQKDQITKDHKYNLRFTEIRQICRTEWTLLDATLGLSAKYGALGGRTVWKPSDEFGRAMVIHHKDYGLTKMCSSPLLEKVSIDEIDKLLIDTKFLQLSNKERFWASLKNFWCVEGRYLRRETDANSSYNRVLGRREKKSDAQQLQDKQNMIDAWLAGVQENHNLKEAKKISKKVFSFKEPTRTFGFINPLLELNYEQMRKRLRQEWCDMKDEEFLTGDKILQGLFSEEGNT